MALFSTFWACSLIGAYSFARDSVFLPRRGSMYPTEGNLSPYPPECVEGEFLEVHECDQSSLACSSVFTPQCAGGLSSAGSRVFSSPIAGSTSSWVRLAVERSAPERSASRRSAPVRFAPVRLAPMRSALNRFALTGFALSRSALIRSASERSALRRCASERSVLGRSALERAASARLASVRSASVRSASERFAPVSFAWARSASDSSALERFARARSASRRLAPVRSGFIERFFPLHEFRVTVATLMASWITPFLGARLPLFRYCLPLGGGG